VVRELGPDETHLAFAAMVELRPHVASVEEFVTRVNERQRPEGYRLAAAFLDGEGDAVSVAGFRTANALHRGFFLYVDDFVTREAHRGGGFGRQVFAWVLAEARRLGCESVSLDSGVQRFGAHRFYLRAGMDITSHHFDLRV
jgi:GNAT superfamily N-acetyltransferase